MCELVEAVGVDLGELQHEAIADDLAEHQLILAVEQQEGVEVQDGRHLLGADTFCMVDLREQLVEGYFRGLQLVVGLELEREGGLHDVVGHEGELAGEGVVGGQLRALAFEGGDGVGDEAPELGDFAKHKENCDYSES